MIGTSVASLPTESVGRVTAVRLRGTIAKFFHSSKRTENHDNASLSTSRRVRQSFMSVDNVLFSIAETVPVFGTSIKGALEALYKVLDLVETRYEIQEDTEALLKRIESLVAQLALAPAPSPALVTLISQLEATSNCLECSLRKKHLRYHVVAKSINECRAQINEYLHQCTLLTVIDIKASMRAKEMTIDSIVVMDPLGFKQVFPKPQRADISVLAEWILGRYDGNTQLQSLLKSFVDRGNFEITIDDGTDVIPVPPEVLPHLTSDTKIVMSVVSYSTGASFPDCALTVPCPLCDKGIPMQVSVCDFSCERTFCPNCDRNVQAYFTPDVEIRAPDEDPKDHIVLLRNVIVKPLLNWFHEQFEYNPTDYLREILAGFNSEETSHIYQKGSQILARMEEEDDDGIMEEYHRFLDESGMQPQSMVFERNEDRGGKDAPLRHKEEDDGPPIAATISRQGVPEYELGIEGTVDVASPLASPKQTTTENPKKARRTVISRRFIGIYRAPD